VWKVGWSCKRLCLPETFVAIVVVAAAVVGVVVAVGVGVAVGTAVVDGAFCG
jgi:hypothetical protein